MPQQIFSLGECYEAVATLKDFGDVIGIGCFVLR